MHEDCPACGSAQPRTGRARWCGTCGAPLHRPAGPAPHHGRRRRGGPPRAWLLAGLAVVALAVGVAGLLVDGGDRGGNEVGGTDVDLPGAVGPPDIPPPVEPGAVAAPARETPRWEIGLDAPAGRVVIVDRADVVVAAVDTRLVGLDLASGEIIWERDLSDERVRALEVAGPRVLAVLGPAGVAAVDAATGASDWRSRRPAEHGLLTPDLLVVSDGERVRGLSLADGTARWTRHGGGVVASGRADDLVLVAREATLLGIDTASGATRWRRSGTSPLERPDQSPSGAVVADAVRLRLLDVADGADVAAVEVEEILEERVRGRPRLAGPHGVVLSVGDGLVGLDRHLDPRWRTRWDAQVALLGHRDPVLAVVGGISVRGVDPATGADVLRVTPSAWFTAGHLLDDRLVLAVHTPTRGRVLLVDLAPNRAGGPGTGG